MAIYLQDEESERSEIEPTIFPDKTSQVWKIGNVITRSNLYIYWEFEKEEELIWLCQLASLLFSYRRILIVPYWPYARQDKQVSDVLCFSSSVFQRTINEFFRDWEIHILDAHSEDSYRLITNSKVINHVPIDAIKPHFHEYDLLLFPDEGAFKRYKEVDAMRSTHCIKTRNQLTGNIESISLPDIDFNNKKVFIVDDICDGGATFINIAEQLVKKGAKYIGLYVTHGLFTRRRECLFEAGINIIHTYNYYNFYYKVKNER